MSDVKVANAYIELLETSVKQLVIENVLVTAKLKVSTELLDEAKALEEELRNEIAYYEQLRYDSAMEELVVKSSGVSVAENDTNTQPGQYGQSPYGRTLCCMTANDHLVTSCEGCVNHEKKKQIQGLYDTLDKS